MVHVFTFHFFLNFVNRAEGIWSSDKCDVRLNLKRNEMLPSLTWKTLEQRRLVFRLKALFLLENVFCLYFSPIAKLWPRKKIIFKVFVFWRYSKTLSLLMVLNSKEYKLFIPLYGLKQPLKVILKISQNLQENTWVRVTFIIKLTFEVCCFIKKRDCGIGAFLWFLRSC